MHDITAALINDRRAVAGFPANSAGIPEEIIAEMDASAKAGEDFDALHDAFAHRLDALITAGH